MLTLRRDRPDGPDRSDRPDGPDRPVEDGASRLLGLVVRALPPGRQAWGAAMRGELAAIESPPARWSFAVSSARVALVDPQSFRGLILVATVTATLVASAAATTAIRYAPVRAESVLLIVGLGVCAVAGRWVRWPGLVGPSRAQRWVRGGGDLVVNLLALCLLWGLRSPGPGGPRTEGLAVKAGGAAFVFGVLLVIAVSLQVVTARRCEVTPVAVAAGAVSGLVVGAGWSVFILVVSPRYHDSHRLVTASLVVLLLAGAAAVTTTLRMGGYSEQGLRSGLIAGTVAALMLVTVPMAVYALLPSTVPDPSPGSYAPQLSQNDHDAQDATEVTDTYVPAYVLGGLLATATVATARPRRRPESSRVSVSKGQPA